MKITNLPTQRQNISIELTPDEQDILASVLDSIRGSGPVRDLTDGILSGLVGLGADCYRHYIE